MQRPSIAPLVQVPNPPRHSDPWVRLTNDPLNWHDLRSVICHLSFVILQGSYRRDGQLDHP